MLANRGPECVKLSEMQCYHTAEIRIYCLSSLKYSYSSPISLYPDPYVHHLKNTNWKNSRLFFFFPCSPFNALLPTKSNMALRISMSSVLSTLIYDFFLVDEGDIARKVSEESSTTVSVFDVGASLQ